MKLTKSFIGAALASAALALAAADAPAPSPKDIAGKQIELCMVGDSITWAGDGDCFRKELVKRVPELAFVGTHTAKFGYSHAGEGGNTTHSILRIIDDPSRIPASRFYHLLVGVNDSSATWGVLKKNPELGQGKAIEQVARPIADRILKILDNLTARPGTEKVFWGTIFPCYPSKGERANPTKVEQYRLRDATASAVNVILRKEIAKYGDKVVMIEYEKPLRARDDWKEIILLHPTPFGYSVVADIAAPYIREHAKPAAAPLDKFGVEVTNLWLEKRHCTRPLVPGWYTVSFDVKSVDGAKITIDLASRNARLLKTPLKLSKSVDAKAGERASFWFFTKYEGYGYNMSPVTVTAANGEIANIMVEKMRPSQKASVYGTGTFVDDKSPMSLGEKFVPVKEEGPNTEARQDTPGARAARKVAPNALRNLNKAFNSHNAALEDAAR